MGSLSEHTKSIKAAIQAAIDDGYSAEFDLGYVQWRDYPIEISLELIQYSKNGEGRTYVAAYDTVFTEERD